MERSADDDSLPPPYLGDYPDGAYWSAVHPAGSVDDDSVLANLEVEGTELRIMWDEGAGPLWGDEGLLPDDPEWLRQALGLSDSLITDLLGWVHAMTAAREQRLPRSALDPVAADLAERVQAEVGSRFRVRFHP